MKTDTFNEFAGFFFWFFQTFSLREKKPMKKPGIFQVLLQPTVITFNACMMSCTLDFWEGGGGNGDHVSVCFT